MLHQARDVDAAKLFIAYKLPILKSNIFIAQAQTIL
jgi:hypothetical protein